VLPTSPMFPPISARLLADQDHFAERNLLSLRNTRLVNFLGLCALSLPSGTPMTGLMLVGAPNDEARLLRIGRAIERALS